MDLQKMIDSISEMGRLTRSNYHLTLGELKERLQGLSPETLVEFDAGASVGAEDSYRGYYHDLAFEPSDKPSTAADVLAACERALTETYQGYKGGDYTYGGETPLWRANYGANGSAIISAIEQDGKLILVTKYIG